MERSMYTLGKLNRQRVREIVADLGAREGKDFSQVRSFALPILVPFICLQRERERVNCVLLQTFKKEKTKGVEALLEIENPNRVAQKSKKVTDIDMDATVVLSRRERFVITVHSVFEMGQLGLSQALTNNQRVRHSMAWVWWVQNLANF